jgi:putative ABC transport system substrate-binding protein
MRRRAFIALLGGGAVAAWPLGARAQRPMPVIGYLSPGSPETDEYRLVALRRGLNETGYTEGQSVAIEYRWAQGQYDRLPALAADLVRRQVSVIITPGAPATVAAKAATSTIPIVFGLGMDPAQSGLVASLNRLGGNLTGLANFGAELTGKRLDLLHELTPVPPIVALLVNPTNNSNIESETTALRETTRSLGLQLNILPASTASDIDAAFDTLAKIRAGALVVAGDPFLTNRRDQIVALASRYAVPAIYGWREYPAEGGLMSYGPNLADSYRLAAVYVAKILKGTSPADLPVEQSVKIELVINLKTAKTLGLAVPMTLLGRADEVIE